MGAENPKHLLMLLTKKIALQRGETNRIDIREGWRTLHLLFTARNMYLSYLHLAPQGNSWYCLPQGRAGHACTVGKAKAMQRRQGRSN